MKYTGILAALLVTATCTLLQAQSVLGPGESRTWQFQLQYRLTTEINSPSQPFGGHVMLDYTYLPQAGPLEYRLDFFEDFPSTSPFLSLPVRHLTGLHDATGMPLLWVPEFSVPPDAWSDLDGVLRLTIESGQMRELTPHISSLVPGSPGWMDSYEAMIIPEPGTLTLIGLGGVLLAHRCRKKNCC